MTRPHFPPSLPTWTGIVIIAFTASACSKSEPTSAPEASTQSPKVPESARVPTSASLVEPGRLPRQLLGWAFQVGKSQVLDTTISMQTTLKGANDVVESLDVPPVSIAASLTVSSAGPSGTTSAVEILEATLGNSPDLAPNELATLRHALQALVGLRGTLACRPDGVVGAIQFGPASDLPGFAVRTLDGYRQALKLVSAPLPVEPVGVGARWVVAEQVDSDGMRINQRIVYEITTMGARSIEVAVLIERFAPAQTVRRASGGTPTELDSLSSRGAGTVAWTLDQIAPSSLSFDSETTMVLMKPGEDGVSQTVSIDAVTEVAMSAR